MNISRETKKAEALRRMRMLGIFPETITLFEKFDLVSVSEPPLGAFFWADEEDKARIRKFEAEHDALVYVVIRTYTTLGKMDSYLFVSDYEEEWPDDRKGIEAHSVMAYVHNYDMPDCSELGHIGIAQTRAAGLCRTW